MEQEIVEFWADSRDEIIGKCIKLSVNDVILGSGESYQGIREKVFDRLWSALLRDMQGGTLAKTGEEIGSLAREAVKYGRDVEPLPADYRNSYGKCRRSGKNQVRGETG